LRQRRARRIAVDLVILAPTWIGRPEPMLAALAVPYLGFGAVILTLESTVFWTIIISLIMVFMLFLPRTVLGDKLLAGAAWILLIGLLNFANGQRRST
jgi:hypothetical protein